MKVFLPNWAYHDYTPPKATKKDIKKYGPSPYDRGKSSGKVRLFDGELKPTVEERPDESRNPYLVKRHKRRPRPYRNRLTGEVVQRYRGGKNFKPVWAPVSFRWDRVDREQPQVHPFEVRRILELALAGADVSGCNIPGIAELAAAHVAANRKAQEREARESMSTGPRLEEETRRERRVPLISIHGEVTWQSTNLPPPRARYQAELSERKRFGRERAWVFGMPMHVDQGRRAKTSEHRNEQGEYGSEVRVTHDGRLYFNKHKLPVTNGVPIRVRGISSYTVERAVRLKNGRKRKMDVQRSPSDAITGRSKTGPKPQHGFTMDARLRKIKQRCKERGIPFVIADHLKLPAVSPPANSPAGAVSPRTRPPYQPLVEIEHMIERLLQRAEKWDDYCGEILDRLADAPPDYILTREEFTVVAAAAVLADRLLPKELH